MSMPLATGLLFFVIGLLAASVHSSCMQDKLVSQSTKYGNAEEYCVYGELKVLPGASFKLPSPDCLDCKCTTQGLSCCGFGVSAGVAIPPEGCVAYNDGCSAIFVKDSNRSELCEPIKPALKRKRTRKPLTRRQ